MKIPRIIGFTIVKPDIYMKTRGFDTSRVERGRRPRKESNSAAFADETSAILTRFSFTVVKALPVGFR
jgi:hypothetical protein